ncbi:MAG TPA: hypothetical protein VMF30_04430 [Pirellulales bacterium]|nr:hypothetical protein [Pirellulales bacterium]
MLPAIATKDRQMRTASRGILLMLFLSAAGCQGVRPEPELDANPSSGFSRKWLTTATEAQIRTNILIKKSQDASSEQLAKRKKQSASTADDAADTNKAANEPSLAEAAAADD